MLLRWGRCAACFAGHHGSGLPRLAPPPLLQIPRRGAHSWRSRGEHSASIAKAAHRAPIAAKQQTTYVANDDKRNSKGFLRLTRLSDINNALDRDRAANEGQRSKSFLEYVWEFEWKFFFSYMALWTMAGWYLIPKMKGFKPGQAPDRVLEEAPELADKFFKTPITDRQQLLNDDLI